eukprot:jgi/Ulvmu1/1433/UM011_0163.1
MSSPSANDGDPANAGSYTWARMFGHIEQKGWQAGSLLGGLLVGPILAYRASNFEVAVTSAGRGGVIGIGLVGILGFAKLHNEPLEAIEDRVYRLYYNEGQNRTDMFCQIGAAAGAGLAAAMVQQKMLRPGVWSVLGGAALGTTAGLLAHGTTAPKKTKTKTEGAIQGLAKDVKDSVDKMG